MIGLTVLRAPFDVTPLGKIAPAGDADDEVVRALQDALSGLLLHGAVSE